MKKLIAIALVSLATMSLQAALVFEQTTLSFNAQSTDRELTAHFKFNNQGGDPITITQVKSSCGCTAAVPSKEQYAPEESGEITATFTFGERSGEQSKEIFVHTDAANDNRHKLVLTVNIEKPLSIEPRVLKWNIGSAPETQRVTITIQNPETMHFEGYEKTVEGFKIKRVENESPKEIWLDITPANTTDRALQKFPVFLKVGDITTSEKVFLLIR